MKKYKVKWEHHVDNDWIDKKMNGNGGSYSFNDTKGLAIIDWIFGRNFIQIFWYNTILFFKYLARRIKKKFEER